VTLSAWLSRISNGMERRTVSLQQLSFLLCQESRKLVEASRRQLFSDWRPVDSEITSISLVQGNEDNHKVNVENTKITTENTSINVSQLQIKQRN